MAVQYFRGNASYKSTLKNVGLKLDQLLLSVGWERVYVNPTAAAGGSDGAPGWNTPPNAYTSAGYVIYKMPADGQATRWLVRVELLYGNNSEGANWYMQIVTGKTLNGGGTDLADPGSVVYAGWVANVAADISNVDEWYMNAYESGWSFCLNKNNANDSGFFIGVERKRTIQGVKTDRLTIYGCSDTSVNQIVMGSLGSGARGGGCITRDAAAGELGPTRWLHLKEPGGSASTCFEPTTTADNLSGVAVPLGPLLTSGGLGGFARLMLVMPLSDVQPGVPIPVLIEGVPRQYIPISDTFAYRAGGRICIATE